MIKLRLIHALEKHGEVKLSTGERSHKNGESRWVTFLELKIRSEFFA